MTKPTAAGISVKQVAVSGGGFEQLERLQNVLSPFPISP